MTIQERKNKLFEEYLIPSERIEKMIHRNKKWDWKTCIVSMKKGDLKEDISSNIDQILYA